jgi:hypothetical protein
MFEVETASRKSQWIVASSAVEKFRVLFMEHVGLWGV